MKLLSSFTDFDILEDALQSALSYQEYRHLVSELTNKNATSGPEQKESLIEYTKLNDRRMNRWDKTLKFPSDAVEKIKILDRKILWLVLTESWCGDASPALPVMYKMTELSKNLELKIILRDENINLMNHFLTHGTMSIPKLISIDIEKRKVLGTWGPRSSTATKMAEDYKSIHGKLTPEFKEELQRWYNKDKGQTILNDLLSLLTLE